jgi:hypothetical protein
LHQLFADIDATHVRTSNLCACCLCALKKLSIEKGAVDLPRVVATVIRLEKAEQAPSSLGLAHELRAILAQARIVAGFEPHLLERG